MLTYRHRNFAYLRAGSPRDYWSTTAILGANMRRLAIALAVPFFLFEAIRYTLRNGMVIKRRYDRMRRAPMIVHPVFTLLRLNDENATVGEGLIVSALYVVLGFAALAIDRRACSIERLVPYQPHKTAFEWSQDAVKLMAPFEHRAMFRNECICPLLPVQPGALFDPHFRPFGGATKRREHDGIYIEPYAIIAPMTGRNHPPI